MRVSRALLIEAMLRQHRGGRVGGPAHSQPPYIPAPAQLTLPDTRILRLRMDAQDELGNVRTAYNWNFETSDRTVFTVRDTEDERIKLLIPGPDLAKDGPPRMAKLTVSASADPAIRSDGTLDTAFDVTVVPGLAADIRITYSVGDDDAAHEWTADELLSFPQNKTATLTMTAIDQKGREVDVTDVTWSNNGSPRYHLEATADPRVVILHVDALSGGIEDLLLVSCDADVASEVVTLEKARSLRLVESAPTQLTGMYDIEWP